MDNDNEFKNLLNSALEGKEFSFEEADWLKAKNYIAEQRKGKKRGLIYFSFVLLISGCLSAYFLMPSNNTSGIQLSENKSSSFIKSKKFNETISNYNANPKQLNKSYLASNTSKPKNSTNSSSFKKREQKSLTSNKKSKTTSKSTFCKNSNNAIQKNSLVRLTNSFTKNNKAVQNTTDSILQEKTLAETLTPIYNYINNATENLEILSTEFNPQINLGVDSVNSLLTQNSIPKNNIPKNIFSMEAGSNYLIGWNNGNTKEGRGFNPVFGVNYYSNIIKKVGFIIGLQYNTINHLNNSIYTTKVTRYKFGEESDVTNFSAISAYYLTVPIKLDYTINANNSFGLGYNVVYLLDVKSKITTYTEGLNHQSNQQVSTSMGYSSGFNKWDGQICVYYKKHIYKNLFINSEFFVGTRDIKNNSIFNSSVFERSLGFKVTLNYNLFKK